MMERLADLSLVWILRCRCLDVNVSLVCMHCRLPVRASRCRPPLGTVQGCLAQSHNRSLCPRCSPCLNVFVSRTSPTTPAVYRKSLLPQAITNPSRKSRRHPAVTRGCRRGHRQRETSCSLAIPSCKGKRGRGVQSGAGTRLILAPCGAPPRRLDLRPQPPVSLVLLPPPK